MCCVCVGGGVGGAGGGGGGGVGGGGGGGGGLTWEGDDLKKVRRSFQASRYPRMHEYSTLRGCTTANSPTCTPARMLSHRSSQAHSMDMRAAGGDLHTHTHTR